MQTAIVIVIVAAALLFMARRMWRQWKGGNSCGCGCSGDEGKGEGCSCDKGQHKAGNGCLDCPLQGKCKSCQ
jgi:hypothetical protein